MTVKVEIFNTFSTCQRPVTCLSTLGHFSAEPQEPQAT